MLWIQGPRLLHESDRRMPKCVLAREDYLRGVPCNSSEVAHRRMKGGMSCRPTTVAEPEPRTVFRNRTPVDVADFAWPNSCESGYGSVAAVPVSKYAREVYP